MSKEISKLPFWKIDYHVLANPKKAIASFLSKCTRLNVFSPMSEFKFSCPHCDQHIQCDDKLSGRQIECPGCHHLIRIPPSAAQAAQGDYSVQSGRTWDTFVAKPTPPKSSSAEVTSEPAPPIVPASRSLFKRVGDFFARKRQP